MTKSKRKNVKELNFYLLQQLTLITIKLNIDNTITCHLIIQALTNVKHVT